MGCWNETCALSGLPIYGGDACVYLEFTSTEAMRRISMGSGWGGALVDILYGTYDSYGRLEKQTHKDWKDASCFILKRFWDFSKSQNKKFLKEYKKEYLAEVKNYQELIESLETVALERSCERLNTIPIRYMPSGYKIYLNDPEQWFGFKALEQTMHSLRRVLYTGDFRGAQSSIKDWKPYIALMDTWVDLKIAKQRNSQ